MTEITVFTATYNRAHTLEKLYRSLISQSVKNFEWLIIDDGSTDNTSFIIDEFIKEDKIKIRYYKQKNHGKHAAINKGAELAEGEWFFTVDSDDLLTEHAIEKVSFYCNQIKNDSMFAGVVGLRGNSQGEAWKSWYGKTKGEPIIKNGYVDANCVEYRYKYGNEGDRAEVVKTSILKQFPFPIFDNEKFLVEGFLWLSIAKAGYKFRWFDEIIYITEYLDDGLTKSINKYYLNNPKGSCAFYNLQMSFKSIPFKVRAKASANYFRYGRYSRYTLHFMCQNITVKIFILTGVPLSAVLVFRDKIKSLK